MGAYPSGTESSSRSVGIVCDCEGVPVPEALDHKITQRLRCLSLRHLNLICIIIAEQKI